ncbi:beta-ketoacyl-[acyl-carrier-protein] synthase family protein [Kitasatospora sp. LaBMicrA B282]|uniref:beta-ketoacyl-[acyl-carrier-protein] synthase family protein n=1 Tax=Kitasatospora sp. LaBMicrA B282 TaxID=3420949 RepID=UPI003D141918
MFIFSQRLGIDDSPADSMAVRVRRCVVHLRVFRLERVNLRLLSRGCAGSRASPSDDRVRSVSEFMRRCGAQCREGLAVNDRLKAGEDVVVTGLGLVTPVGVGVESSWKGLLTGVSAAATDPDMAGLSVDFRCRVPEFESGVDGRLVRRLDPGALFALIAVREACRDAALDPQQWDAQRVGVVLGVSGSSLQHLANEFALLAGGEAEAVSALIVPRSLPSSAASEAGLDLGARGPVLAVAAACASGTVALGTARDLLLANRCDVVFAGGAESPDPRFYAAAFGQLGALSTRAADPGGACRPFDRGRDGFVLGEGAGVLVLERAAHARARGARPRARFAGFGCASEAHHFTAPHPAGRGFVDAARQALREADLADTDIHHVNAHATATVLGDRAELTALRAVFRDPPAVTAIKSVVGHALGGAGGIQAVCTVLTLRDQVIPPTANFCSPDPGVEADIVHKEPRQARIRAALTQSSGFGGHTAAAVFTAS